MNNLEIPPAEPGPIRGRPTPLTFVLNFFSSIWLGVFLAVLLFVYCSIGSALPAVRQHAWLEMTEFEWFHWWPFNLLVALFATVMVIATIRRIPLRKLNAGVWMIHTGIIMMTLGSYVYFGTKVEGDAPVFRRQVRIELPKLAEPVSMVVLPGNSTNVVVGPDVWRFSIQSTNSEWPILSDEHKGEKVYSVNVMVTPPAGEPFVRQLLDGFPQYTEDVLPGKGRAINAVGTKLVNNDLKLSLVYHPTEYFHLMQSWCLYSRRVGETKWHERPIEGLPRYNDRVSARDQVFPDPHDQINLRPIDIPIRPGPEGDPLIAARVHATGYLRHAHFERRWREGADRLNPVIELSLLGAQDKFTLIAFDPVRSRAANGNILFWWLDDPAEIASLPNDSRAVLSIAVPEADVLLDVPVTPELIGSDYRPIDGTDFSYRVTGLQDNLSIPGRERPVSIAMVDIKGPEGVFRRWVADQDDMTRDMRDGAADPHAVQADRPDRRILTTYRPATAPIIFAGHPGGLHFLFNGPDGQQINREVRAGEVVQVLSGLALRVDNYVRRGLSEVKPFIVPPNSRQRDAGETFAMIRLEIDTGRGVESKWVRFNHYAFPSEQYAYAGRFAYQPERFRLADGSEVEVMFSRKRMRLPSPIAMEDFDLDTHLGGYTGSAITIRNYISRLRFQDGPKWTDPEPIAVNSPTEHGGFWYFQSTWDRPPAENPTGGMNYTGLGIGNRHGVYVQLAGCCIAVVGMIFAFYIKPVIKRRRAAQQAQKAYGNELEDPLYVGVSRSAEPVEV